MKCMRCTSTLYLLVQVSVLEMLTWNKTINRRFVQVMTIVEHYVTNKQNRHLFISKHVSLVYHTIQSSLGLDFIPN